ncbi:nuclease-related domain-containing protein [Sporolactobacillus sp. THM19-2]|uniref:nuclease-related domain-containing protein n=1 Tax=Sporolactobacillus sp. THM19-2 TaxID=2511171 RepID=UPI00102280BF|nr:nuclease-related domain-containing protein [Sporolactobacillus sp. THM19-2]RYL94549.1 NERD domain-containing protein [Sporolactobacillus sp. THM19-2]
MAQLIKIGQCVSRYQIHLMRYAHRFILLKKRRQEQWMHRENREQPSGSARKHEKDLFEEWIYDMQTEWATRTAVEQSRFPEAWASQSWVKRLLTEVNDLSFFMFRPVLKAGEATIQLDSLLLTADAVWCLTALEGERGSVFQGISRRKWREIRSDDVRELLNPLIALKRTRRIVSGYLGKFGLSVPVLAAVYVPNGFIEFVQEESGLSLVDLRNESAWLRLISRHSMMMKRDQIAATEALLSGCVTVASDRWRD